MQSLTRIGMDATRLECARNTKFSKTETKKEERRPYRRNAAKPPYSYVGLLTVSIWHSKQQKQTVQETASSLRTMFPAFGEIGQKNWQAALRHALTTNACFIRIFEEKNDKRCYWTVDLSKVPANAFNLQSSRDARYQTNLLDYLGLPPFPRANLVHTQQAAGITISSKTARFSDAQVCVYENGKLSERQLPVYTPQNDHGSPTHQWYSWDASQYSPHVVTAPTLPPADEHSGVYPTSHGVVSHNIASYGTSMDEGPTPVDPNVAYSSNNPEYFNQVTTDPQNYSTWMDGYDTSPKYQHMPPSTHHTSELYAMPEKYDMIVDNWQYSAQSDDVQANSCIGQTYTQHHSDTMITPSGNLAHAYGGGLAYHPGYDYLQNQNVFVNVASPDTTTYQGCC